MSSSTVAAITLNAVTDKSRKEKEDLLAVEEPLEIRLAYGEASTRTRKKFIVTMRTPGNDFELAAGFLLAEGVIDSPEDVLAMHHCRSGQSQESGNILMVELSPSLKVNLEDVQHRSLANSSCGVCGKSSIEAVFSNLRRLQTSASVETSAEVIDALPKTLRSAQTVFGYTGGLHAAALFSAAGKLLELREDIGRHNALDKLLGAILYKNSDSFQKSILFLSGRAGFEMVQKAAAANIPVVASVSAPSSLAVELAKKAGITLIGFVRSGRFNIYSRPERVK